METKEAAKLWRIGAVIGGDRGETRCVATTRGWVPLRANPSDLLLWSDYAKAMGQCAQIADKGWCCYVEAHHLSWAEKLAHVAAERAGAAGPADEEDPEEQRGLTPAERAARDLRLARRGPYRFNQEVMEHATNARLLARALGVWPPTGEMYGLPLPADDCLEDS